MEMTIKKIKAEFHLAHRKANNQHLVLVAPVDKKGQVILDPKKEMFGYHVEANDKGQLILFPFVTVKTPKKLTLNYGFTFADEDVKGESAEIPKGCQFHELRGLDVPIKKGNSLQMIVGDEKIDMFITEITDPF